MTTYQVLSSIGKRVSLNGLCDLAMDSEMKPYISQGPKAGLKILKLTKGGKVHMQDSTGKCLSAYPTNVDLVSNE